MDIATLGIRVTSTGTREASRDLQRLEKDGAAAEKRALTIGKAWGKAFGTAIAGGVGLGAAAFGRYIKNSIEAERVQAQLNATLKSTAGAAGLSAREINTMADALQSVTTFDDEAITGAQSLLLTFTKIGRDIFPRATEAVLDMATALGTDLKSAALQVGKALNDPVQGMGALSRAGVQFSEAEKTVIKEMVETNRLADAQKIVLKELETQMGGSARAARETLGGALQALGNTVDNLLEGDAGSGGLKGTTDAVNDLSDTLNSPTIKQGIDTVASGLARIAAEAVNGIGALARFSQNLTDVFSISDKLSKGLGPDAFSDRQLQIRMANVQEQISKARKSGNNDELKRLLTERERLVRESTHRIRLELGREGKITSKPGTGIFANVLGTGDPLPATAGEATGKKDKARKLRDTAAATHELTAAEKLYKQVAEDNLMIDEAVDSFRQDQIATAYDLAKATDARMASNDAFVQSMRDELTLAGLSSDEREREINLRQLSTDATDEQRQAVAELTAELQAERKIGAFKDDLKDLFVDIGMNFGHARDALDDFFDRLKARALEALAEDLIGKLFNTGGTAGAGGGWVGTALGALFGGGRAHGGPVSAGRLYEVGERGPELLTVHGRNFMIPGAAGHVTPTRSIASSGPSPVYQTINVQGRVDGRTASQIASQSGREIGRAMRRNG